MAVDSFFKKVHGRNSGGLSCGDRGGQIPRPTMQSPMKSCKRAVVPFAVWAVTHTWWNSNPIHYPQAKQRIVSRDLHNFQQSLYLGGTMVPQFLFYTVRTKHQSLTKAKDFHAVSVDFQHSLSYSFDYYIPTQGDNASSANTKCATNNPLHASKPCCR